MISERFSLNYSLFFNVDVFSRLICLMILIFNIRMIFWLRRASNQIILKQRFDIRKEYPLIYQNLDPTEKNSLYYPILKVFKKCCLSFFVLFLEYDMAAFALFLFFLSLLMFFFIRIIVPFKNKYRNMVAEITEILHCCLYVLMFLYEKSRMKEINNTPLYIGNSAIVIVAIIIVLNFGVLTTDLFNRFTIFIFNVLGKFAKMGNLIFESIKMKKLTTNYSNHKIEISQERVLVDTKRYL